MENKEKSRIIKIAVIFAITALILLSAVVALGSVEIAKIRQQIAGISEQNLMLNKSLLEINENSKKFITKEDLIALDLKDGVDGKDGNDGEKGKDSVSTNTIIEKQTIIEKELPPNNGLNGSDGREIQIGLSKDGTMVWKYSTDRLWQALPIVDVNVGSSV